MNVYWVGVYAGYGFPLKARIQFEWIVTQLKKFPALHTHDISQLIRLSKVSMIILYYVLYDMIKNVFDFNPHSSGSPVLLYPQHNQKHA